MENLVKEYNALTDDDKTKVQTVHDYLVRPSFRSQKFDLTK